MKISLKKMVISVDVKFIGTAAYVLHIDAFTMICSL